MVENLFNLIKDKKINPLEEDKSAWKLTKDGCFLIKSSFDFLEGERETDLFPKRLFWNKWVPSKMGFFAWEAWWGRVLIMDQLKRRGFSLANRCPLYRKDEENIEHLLLHCPHGLGNLVLFVDVCGSCLGAPPPWLIKDWFFG